MIKPYLSTLCLLALSSISFAQQQQQQQQPGQKVPSTHPVQNNAPHLPAHPLHVMQGPGFTLTYNGWRRGFSPYPGVTITRIFSFQNYVYEPVDNSVIVASPFYFYPNLPPFLDSSVAEVPAASNDAQSDPSSAPSNGAASSPVQSNSDTPNDSNSSTGIADADDAVALLKRAWENGSGASVDVLLPSSGQVQVSVGDQQYALEAKDFLPLIHDGISGTRTAKMSVLDQHVDANEIELRMLHTFMDANGQLRTVYQTYRLVKEGSKFVIRSFGSDSYSQPNSDSVSS